MEITTDQIRDIAVKVTEGYINEQISLSEGIAKQASMMELNSEHIKRAVEASNQVAYLKLLSMSKDRTFEFPTAKYEDVMGHMVHPLDSAPVMPQSANNSTQAETSDATYDPPLAEKQAMARHLTLQHHARIKEIEIEKAAVLMNIGDCLVKTRKEELFLEKLAEVANEEDFPKLVKLASGKNASEVVLRKHIFRDEELNGAKELMGLFKKAQELLKETEEKIGLDKTAFIKGLTGGLGMAAGATAAGVIGAGASIAKSLMPSAGKKKIVDAGDIIGASFIKTKPENDVWANLHGNQKRY